MFFNSLEFILFLPIVFVIFHSVTHKLKPYILLLASYYFYASWNPAYLLLIIASTLTDFSSGLLLEKYNEKIRRQAIVCFSLVTNIGLLVYFKYTNFFIDTFNRVNYKVGSPFDSVELIDIILPVGISFYTFQTISYTIDVYNKKIKPEKKLALFALYVSFFPQLVAGPIERFGYLTNQLKAKVKLTKENISYGARLILYGFFMKMVIADNLSIIVDSQYQNITEAHSLNLIITAVLYSFQIYCDFHGYSTIAIGTARLFNIKLSTNFKTPYLSYSLTSFWRNWHITLSSWFRDYIYYPLGGNKGSKIKWIVALMIVFIVSGFWHGAKWTFIMWGFLHGLITLLEKASGFEKKSKKLFINFLKVILTFSIVSLLWILFRSSDINSATNYYTCLYSNWGADFNSIAIEPLVLLVSFIVIDYYTFKSNFAKKMKALPITGRWSIYFVMIFLILSRSGTEVKPFIYFQF